MTKLKWDQSGEKVYETGVEQGVLYKKNGQGVYDTGFAWNGLISVSESPSGAESNKSYANNRVYANLISAEEFSATLEAYTYPKEFAECDGSAALAAGVFIGQQRRVPFGLSYKTLLGNDILDTAFGYKLHLIYDGMAAPSEKAYTTINDSPEGITLSWEISTTAIDVPGFKPTASLTIDSTQVNAAKLADLETILYGTTGVEPRLPLPEEVAAIFNGAALTLATPAKPSNVGNVITIPTTTGVDYQIDGVTKPAGSVTITKDTLVTAKAKAGYKFPLVTDVDWLYTFA